MTKVVIDNVEAIPLRIPFDHWAPPPLFGGQPRTTIDTVLVRITGSDGTIGWGQIYSGGWQSAVVALRDWVVPLVIGADVTDTTLQIRVERALQNLGRSGPVIHAISGVDIAMWDIRGKLAGVPVHALLGGRKRERVQVYASLLQYGGSIDHVSRNVERALERGYAQIKLHERTPDTVLAARKVAGPGIPLMLDTNCAWTPDEAKIVADKITSAKLLWLEEPIWPPEDFSALADLRKSTGVPIATGENASSEQDFLAAVEMGAADYIQPSATKVGLTALWRACQAVESVGATCVPHVPYFGPGFLASLHVLAAKHRESALERFFCDLARTPYLATVPISEGWIQVPDAPGLGAEPEPDLWKFKA
jgi:L-alanine-DL-glutamate epimerase-like enolase superfamily enzyme